MKGFWQRKSAGGKGKENGEKVLDFVRRDTKSVESCSEKVADSSLSFRRFGLYGFLLAGRGLKDSNNP